VVPIDNLIALAIQTRRLLLAVLTPLLADHRRFVIFSGVELSASAANWSHVSSPGSM